MISIHQKGIDEDICEFLSDNDYHKILHGEFTKIIYNGFK